MLIVLTNEDKGAKSLFHRSDDVFSGYKILGYLGLSAVQHSLGSFTLYVLV